MNLFTFYFFIFSPRQGITLSLNFFILFSLSSLLFICNISLFTVFLFIYIYFSLPYLTVLFIFFILCYLLFYLLTVYSLLSHWLISILYFFYCLLRVFKIQKTLRAAPFSLLSTLLTTQSICNPPPNLTTSYFLSYPFMLNNHWL